MPAAAHAAIERRLENAIATALDTVRRSGLLVAASHQRRAAGLVTRCAWCGRYALGREFVERDEAPGFVASGWDSNITHGICPGCIDELKRTGQSR